jgi:threonine/homoserine/homoserine lactone efflux protein
VKLLLAEAGGYISVVLPVAILAAPLLAGHPAIAIAMKIAAATWVLFLAYRLWTRGAVVAGGSVVSLRTMYVTTLLNPKALIVGLVIMPHGPAVTVLPWAAVFLVSLIMIAIVWICAGALASTAASGRPILPVICRLAAVCLVIFSGVLLQSAAAALGVSLQGVSRLMTYSIGGDTIRKTDKEPCMSLKTLAASSNLEGMNVAALYDAFRHRVGEKRNSACRIVRAFESADNEMFYELANANVGDGAFDQALHDSFAAGEIEPALFHPLMYTLLEAASSAGADGGRDTVIVTELFALPLTGTIEEVLDTSSSLNVALGIARKFSETGYVADGTRVLLSPTTIDPFAAAVLRPAIARQIAHEFQDAFDSGYDEAAAERLFEAVQAPFELLAASDRNHLEEPGTVTRLMIGATQRALSTTHSTNADAFLFNMLDEVTPDEMLERSESFIEAICNVPGVNAALYYPLPIARATSFAAIAALGNGLQTETQLLGVQRPDRILDEIVVTRVDGKVFAEGIVGSTLVGPCSVPEELVRRDDAWFLNHLALYADELSQREELMTSGMQRN